MSRSWGRPVTKKTGPSQERLRRKEERKLQQELELRMNAGRQKKEPLMISV